MNEQTIALVALFNGNGELLLLKRADEAHCGGLWSFPGGKVEENENPLDAAKRELHEEARLNGEEWRKLGESRHDYPDRSLRFHLFACRCIDTTGLSPESEAAWVPLTQLSDYPMPEANTALLPLLEVDG